jgi:hypothetical protein
MHAAGFLGMGMDVDGNDLLDVGDFQLGHGLPGEISNFRVGKLIIGYNKLRKGGQLARKTGQNGHSTPCSD